MIHRPRKKSQRRTQSHLIQAARDAEKKQQRRKFNTLFRAVKMMAVFVA